MTERLPPPDGNRIVAAPPEPSELIQLDAGTVLVRIHHRGGAYPTRWNEFRHFGPTKSRFDHHPGPPRVHAARAILYATIGRDALTAALAEYFQRDEVVKPFDLATNKPVVSMLAVREPITLLDLDSGWVTRVGGNQAITSGSRASARSWARAIYRYHGQGPAGVHGVVYRSSVWGPGRCVALWERAERSLASTPIASRSLCDPLLAPAIANAAARLGTIVV